MFCEKHYTNLTWLEFTFNLKIQIQRFCSLYKKYETAQPRLEYTMKAKSAFKLVDDQVPNKIITEPSVCMSRASLRLIWQVCIIHGCVNSPCDWCQQLLQPSFTIPQYSPDQEDIKHFSTPLAFSTILCFLSVFLCSLPSILTDIHIP